MTTTLTIRIVLPQALASALPPERKRAARAQPKLELVKAFIDEILRADRQVPRNQRHTAHRVWARIVGERPEAAVAESTVRHYVRRKRELGLAERETFVPQTYGWGSEAQAIGTKPWPTSAENASRYGSSACARWPSTPPFSWPCPGWKTSA